MAKEATKTKAIPTSDAPGNPTTADAPRHLTKQEFGNRLKRAMLEKGLHHAELARRAGLPRNNISTYINGRSYPSQQSLAAIAKVLGMEADDLLPNRLEMAIRGEQMPDLSMKTAFGDPSQCWLVVNRRVSTALASHIIGLLEQERTHDEGKASPKQ